LVESTLFLPGLSKKILPDLPESQVATCGTVHEIAFRGVSLVEYIHGLTEIQLIQDFLVSF
jgi:hypothetical protein